VQDAAILIPRAAALERIKVPVIDALPSPESKRVYRQALDDFFRWYEAEAADGFSKATVNAYRASLLVRWLSPSTINQRLSAIRKLALEAADNDFRQGGTGTDSTKLGSRVNHNTEQYLGVRQDLTDAPCDHLGLTVDVPR
jgi:Phage integrase, N-terminal SAM-like domain